MFLFKQYLYAQIRQTGQINISATDCVVELKSMLIKITIKNFGPEIGLFLGCMLNDQMF